MSLPNIAHPWSFSETIAPLSTESPRASLSGAQRELKSPDAAPIASALFAAGFVSSAIALADADTDAGLRATAEAWRQTATIDACLSAMISRGAGAMVPSVSTRADGSPRFLLRLTDTHTAARTIAVEHGSDGMHAELRLFLDEALRDGDRFVDAAPDAGFACLSAATCGRAVSVIALCADAASAAAIDASAHWSDVPDAVSVRVHDSLSGIAFAPTTHGATTVLHLGGAEAVAPLLTDARDALERREIGAVAWRCGRADERSTDADSVQIAAAVLGVFGFQHFALTQRDTGMELVPADAMATNEMIFSLEPSFVARFTA
jgi:hypothetical protein